jgi:hypothetical protein
MGLAMTRLACKNAAASGGEPRASRWLMCWANAVDPSDLNGLQVCLNHYGHSTFGEMWRSEGR